MLTIRGRRRYSTYNALGMSNNRFPCRVFLFFSLSLRIAMLVSCNAHVVYVYTVAIWICSIAVIEHMAVSHVSPFFHSSSRAYICVHCLAGMWIASPVEVLGSATANTLSNFLFFFILPPIPSSLFYLFLLTYRTFSVFDMHRGLMYRKVSSLMGPTRLSKSKSSWSESLWFPSKLPIRNDGRAISSKMKIRYYTWFGVFWLHLLYPIRPDAWFVLVVESAKRCGPWRSPSFLTNNTSLIVSRSRLLPWRNV